MILIVKDVINEMEYSLKEYLGCIIGKQQIAAIVLIILQFII
jgi:hypothetical protein